MTRILVRRDVAGVTHDVARDQLLTLGEDQISISLSSLTVTMHTIYMLYNLGFILNCFEKIDLFKNNIWTFEMIISNVANENVCSVVENENAVHIMQVAALTLNQV